MQRVVLLEGPDRCGKTEIAAGLSSLTGIPVFKNPREAMFFEDDPGYFTKAMKYGDPVLGEFIRQTGCSAILDRSYPSEYVYSQAFERTTDWGMLRVVDELFASLGARVICAYRTDYLKTSPDQFSAITKERLAQIHGLYEQFCGWTRCRVLRLCVDDEDLASQMGIVVPFVVGDDSDRH